MIFQVDQVREAFKKHGEIATYRPGELPDSQEFWIRPSRTGPKIGEADLFKAARVTESVLEPFEKAHREMPTGFSFAQDWYNKIGDMHGHVKPGWILYLDARWIEGDATE